MVLGGLRVQGSGFKSVEFLFVACRVLGSRVQIVVSFLGFCYPSVLVYPKP